MNIGSLYTVKKYFWMLFPTKELVAPTHAANHLTPSTIDAAYWSKRLNCEITYFSPETLVVFLEEDGDYKKVLTSNGRIGWTRFNQDDISCFEEVKTE